MKVKKAVRKEKVKKNKMEERESSETKGRTKQEIIPRDEAVEVLGKLSRETAVRSYRLPPTEHVSGHLMLCVDLEVGEKE